MSFFNNFVLKILHFDKYEVAVSFLGKLGALGTLGTRHGRRNCASCPF